MTICSRKFSSNKCASTRNRRMTTVVNFSGPLDALTVQTNSALSVPRRLTKNWTSHLIDVRRDSDNTVQSIGYNSSNVLDQVALLSFVGAGNGFVSKWWDQSGNGNHATQGTNAAQPQIVTSGVVNLQGGLPAIRFLTYTSTLPAFQFASSTSDWTWNLIFSSDNYTLNSVPGGDGSYGSSGIQINALSVVSGAQFSYASNEYQVPFTITLVNGQAFITSLVYNSSLKNATYVANGNSGAPVSVPLYVTGSSGFVFGGGYGSLTGTIQESISFPSALSTQDRQTLEHNQEAFYSITGS